MSALNAALIHKWPKREYRAIRVGLAEESTYM